MCRGALVSILGFPVAAVHELPRKRRGLLGGRGAGVEEEMAGVLGRQQRHAPCGKLDAAVVRSNDDGSTTTRASHQVQRQKVVLDVGDMQHVLQRDGTWSAVCASHAEHGVALADDRDGLAVGNGDVLRDGDVVGEEGGVAGDVRRGTAVSEPQLWWHWSDGVALLALGLQHEGIVVDGEGLHALRAVADDGRLLEWSCSSVLRARGSWPLAVAVAVVAKRSQDLPHVDDVVALGRLQLAALLRAVAAEVAERASHALCRWTAWSTARVGGRRASVHRRCSEGAGAWPTDGEHRRALLGTMQAALLLDEVRRHLGQRWRRVLALHEPHRHIKLCGEFVADEGAQVVLRDGHAGSKELRVDVRDAGHERVDGVRGQPGGRGELLPETTDVVLAAADVALAEAAQRKHTGAATVVGDGQPQRVSRQDAKEEREDGCVNLWITGIQQARGSGRHLRSSARSGGRRERGRGGRWLSAVVVAIALVVVIVVVVPRVVADASAARAALSAGASAGTRSTVGAWARR